jgi:hypothetical protein
MWLWRLMIPVVLGSLAACSTPYNRPVLVQDSATFPGIAAVIAQNDARTVDVILVHGMCTHTASWADSAIDSLSAWIDANYKGKAGEAPPAATKSGIDVVQRTEQIAGGTVRYHGLIWSPLTAGLKQQLAYDNTGTPSDCVAGAECKPVRAHFNGLLKDKLLNDCLSDAMIYEGRSHAALKQAMIDTVSRVLEDSEARAGHQPGPLVVIAESLGSKMLFDALSAMLQPDAPPRLRELGQRTSRRLALVFMAGNQIPILALAEQQTAPTGAATLDSLQRFLTLRRLQPAPLPKSQVLSKLAVVAFTDPNDLLSYRLLPARYAGPDVTVADVLVSNANTWLGMLEDPFAAHLDYMKNAEVGGMIACGWPRAAVCK